MAPKIKYTREEIIACALTIVKAEGMEALTARRLGQELGTSTRPIFTAFVNMEEVNDIVTEAIKDVYHAYIEKGLQHENPFKEVGMQYIRFAKEEPKLFQIMFMREVKGNPAFSHILPMIDEHYTSILKSIQEVHHITDVQALCLYQHLWIYTHGIAALCATKMCQFTEAEISRLLTEICSAQLKEIRKGS